MSSTIHRLEHHSEKKRPPGPQSAMEDLRSRSYGDGRMQIQSYYGAGDMGPISSSGVSNMQDLRCYSASYASSVYPTQSQAQTQVGNNDVRFKKGKSANGSVSKSWSFNDPELQRKKRVASYKVYSVEGKVKGSFKKSFRWLKDRI
ncbi:hypothetical protein MANES_03G035900v8 [Manihot esculenta]|uniref:Uncharacterized protein n=1 Tax=Manihot esculenta TaxID=3983 RepID=A0ACB7HZ39_MANES|nr:hypothetical protein MANES_03G035900v8 [Manihot esculenta]